MMSVKPGARVWIPCEVKTGPFSNERLVRVESPAGESVAFVSTAHLRDPVVTGRTFVDAVVTTVEGGTFTAVMLGHPVGPNAFQGDVARATRLGSLKA